MKIGLGGGCHWCTEAVFKAVKGVHDVRQGYISAKDSPDKFYEGIVFNYDPELVKLEDLILIHLSTHQSMKDHSMRHKYRSALYVYDQLELEKTWETLKTVENSAGSKFITSVYELSSFKESRAEIRNYYQTDPQRPFCTRYIKPKLDLLFEEFKGLLKEQC
ncbi:peptide-methionine (S)-S-oxide reductase [Gramella sp. Hel_I_59]|uniref:peptide-methionine (S)-S-oxide reductase n=1 Tax=Gramella sp. Hel_I_59 TaxID=1249978 RepID=UPI00114F4A71|nr:peptide-methionine (S)-S-oxide reductase [Gramella sp. Hel_I_59]TQI70802.1 peptide-methionine (S)-S-oxide reductase [Gramella sp. Hel_I_59]